MDDASLRLLLIAADPDDATFVRDALARDRFARYVITVARRPGDGLAMIAQGPFDAILLKLELTDSQGLETFRRVYEAAGEIPIVVLSDTVDEEMAFCAVQAGAQDHVVKKGQTGSEAVTRAVRYAVERCQAQARLHANEKYWRTLIQQSNDGIALVSAEGTILYESPAITRVLGYDPAELVGRAAFDLLHPEDQGIAARYFAEILAHPGQPIASETRFVHKNGETVWVEAASTNWLADPDLHAIIINYRDITERKQAESRRAAAIERLRASAADLAEAQNVAKLGSWRFDIASNAVSWSDELYRVFDVDKGEFGGMYQSFLNKVHPDDKPRVLETNRRARATGEPFQVEYRITTRSGDLKHVFEYGYAYTDAHGDVVGLFGIAQDITERKQAEDKLRQSEARFRRLFDNNMIPMGISALSGEILDANDALLTLIGHTRAEMDAGEIRWDEITPSAYRERDLQAVREVQQQGFCAPYEKEFRHKDGHAVPILIGCGTFDEQTETDIFYVIDLATLKRGEDERARLNERLDLATKAARMGIWDWDIQQNEIVWDDRMYALYGLEPGEFGGAYEAWLRGVHPDDRASSNEVSARAVRGEAPYDTEFRVLWPDGSVHWLKADGEVFRDQSGRPVRMVGVNYDITERKKTEQELKRWADIFQNVAFGFVVGNPEDRRLGIMNPAFARMHGYTMDELIGAPLADVFAPEDRAELPERIRLTHEQGHHVWEARHLRKDGTVFPVTMDAMAVKDDQGKVLYRIVSVQDITERKRVEDELRRSNAELEQFAYIASHDLQEPLRTVAGMVQLLQQRYQGQLDERADEYIHFAVDAAGRMQQLISDLLDFSRIDRKGKPFAEADTERVLQSALANLQTAIAESGAQITHDPLPVVLGDAAQLTMVLQNLVGNAIKFRGEQPIEVHIGAEKVEKGWQFSVRDNGIGIDPQYFERVFLIFQRLHTRRKYPGTGIGLALCKKIIERHGGKIWIQSEPNHGATFFFTLPERSPA